MASIMPLVAIVGTTGSGKTALAIELARQFNGEIICADSRTIYKGMDIGTAKPTEAERRMVEHHLLDVVSPDQKYSAAEFKSAASAKIHDISARGKLPIMVGGSGLYVDSVLFDYQFQPVDIERRAELEGLSLVQLQAEARAVGIDESKVDFKNPRHLQRAVETKNVLINKQHLRENTLVIGLNPSTDVLTTRIKKRVDKMITDGFVQEVKVLGDTYGWDGEAMTGIGYRALAKYIKGELSLEEAKDEFARGDLSLAKRQRTWFKRNKNIHWINDAEQAFDLLRTFLGHTRQ